MRAKYFNEVVERVTPVGIQEKALATFYVEFGDI